MVTTAAAVVAPAKQRNAERPSLELRRELGLQVDHLALEATGLGGVPPPLLVAPRLALREVRLQARDLLLQLLLRRCFEWFSSRGTAMSMRAQCASATRLLWQKKGELQGTQLLSDTAR